MILRITSWNELKPINAYFMILNNQPKYVSEIILCNQKCLYWGKVGI